jgi:hypothetical protein
LASDGLDGVISMRDDSLSSRRWLIVPLWRERTLVAVALLAGPAKRLAEPSPMLVADLARELDEAGDALTS